MSQFFVQRHRDQVLVYEEDHLNAMIATSRPRVYRAFLLCAVLLTLSTLGIGFALAGLLSPFVLLGVTWISVVFSIYTGYIALRHCGWLKAREEGFETDMETGSSDLSYRAQRFKDLRLQKGLTQDQLGKMAGVHMRTLRRIEAEGKASFETWRAVASALDLPVEHLLEAPKASSSTLLVQWQEEAQAYAQKSWAYTSMRFRMLSLLAASIFAPMGVFIGEYKNTHEDLCLLIGVGVLGLWVYIGEHARLRSAMIYAYQRHPYIELIAALLSLLLVPLAMISTIWYVEALPLWMLGLLVAVKIFEKHYRPPNLQPKQEQEQACHHLKAAYQHMKVLPLNRTKILEHLDQACDSISPENTPGRRVMQSVFVLKYAVKAPGFSVMFVEGLVKALLEILQDIRSYHRRFEELNRYETQLQEHVYPTPHDTLESNT